MAIPTFQTLMRPLLELAADGNEHSLRDARKQLADRFQLTEEEQQALLPSGRQAIFVNRVAWAKVYLQIAGILGGAQKGHFKISDRGRKALLDAPEEITIDYLEQFPEFVQFRSKYQRQISVKPGSTDLASSGATTSGEESGIENEIPEELNIAVPFDPDQIEVTTKTMTIDLILSRIASGAIDLQPEFQRHWGIWSIRRQSRLIESLLLRIPLPTFYAAENESEDWEIVDGIQRLSTIARFIQPELLQAEGFALEGLEYLHDFEGKRYEGLSLRLQRRLKETELVVHLIRHGTPLDVKFNIFARINTGGMPLTAQELRHAIIPGNARTILEEWAQSPEFRQATSDSVGDTRMEDRELVLRFVAFWLTSWKEYKDKDLDSFLTHAMKRLSVAASEDVGSIRDKFNQAMIAAYQLFGADAFRKRYTADGKRSLINKALFEALSTNLAKLTGEEVIALVKNKDELRTEFIKLCNDRDFDSAISQGTSDPRRVKIRFTKIAELLAKAV